MIKNSSFYSVIVAVIGIITLSMVSACGKAASSTGVTSDMVKLPPTSNTTTSTSNIVTPTSYIVDRITTRNMITAVSYMKKGNTWSLNQYDSTGKLQFVSTHNVLDEHYSNATYNIQDAVLVEEILEDCYHRVGNISKQYLFYDHNTQLIGYMYLSSDSTQKERAKISSIPQKIFFLPIEEYSTYNQSECYTEITYSDGKVTRSELKGVSNNIAVDAFESVSTSVGPVMCAKIIVVSESSNNIVPLRKCILYVEKNSGMVVKSEYYDFSTNRFSTKVDLVSRNF